jgi:hypothetical protein
MLHGPFSTREARVDDPARLEEAFRPGSVSRIEDKETRRGPLFQLGSARPGGDAAQALSVARAQRRASSYIQS